MTRMQQTPCSLLNYHLICHASRPFPRKVHLKKITGVLVIIEVCCIEYAYE